MSGGISAVKTLETARHQALIQKREAPGLTQADLAEKLGEYQSFVARLESGQRRVDVIKFLALAELLGFDPEQVIREIRERF